MAVIKLSPENIHKNDGSSKIKLDRSRISVDSARVSGYETRNKESYDALEKYRQRINSGGYLSAEDLDAYRKALDSYVETSTRLRDLSRFYGQSVDDDDAWTKTIADMESGYQGISDYFSQWKTEVDFRAAMEQAKAYEKRMAELTNGYDPTKNQQEGMTGWDDFQAYLDRTKNQQQAQEKEKTIWDTILEGIGAIGSDTSLPGIGGSQVVAMSEEAQRNDTELAMPKERWTDEERYRFGYLWNTERQKAWDYARAVNMAYAKQDESAKIQGIQESATDNFWAGAGNTLGAIATSPLGMADYLKDLITYGAVGYIPQADGEISPFEYSQAVTSGVAQHLNDAGGTINDNIPVLGGKGWGDVYGLGTSIAQSSLAAYTGGSGQALITFFGSAAASGVDDALSRGADGAQALFYGTSVGAAEALAEMAGIDNLLKIGASAGKQLLFTLVKQAGAEGLEEGLTTFLGNVADQVWLGDKSNFYLRVQAYMSAGFSESEAKSKAWSELWGELAFDALGGFVSGAVHAGPQTAYHTFMQNSYAKNTYGGSQKELVGEALEINPDNAFAKKMQGRLDSGKNLSGGQLNALVQQNEATIAEQDMASIQKAAAQRLTELGATENVEATAAALAKQAAGQELSHKEKQLIKEYGSVVSQEMNPENIRSGKYNAEWAQKIGTNKINANEYSRALMDLAQEKAGAKSSRTNPAEQSEENAPADGTVDATKENGVESASEADTGPAKVKSIAAIKNKRATVALEDGTEADVRDVDLDPNDGVRIETIASIDGISATDANFIFKTLRENTGASAQMDALGAKDAYRYGFYGFSKDLMTKQAVFANSLTEAQRNAIYEVGQKARQQQIEKAAPKTTAKQRGVYFDHGGGNVVAFKDADKKTLTEDKRKAGVQAALILNKLGIGGSIYFFESYRNAKGQLVYKDSNGKEVKAPNGWYSEKDGSIHIDLNAGRGGNGLVMFTLAHELTHFIEQWSPAKYKILADFLIENYEKGQSMDALIRKKQAKLSELRGEEISYDEAYSEVIADSMEAMLADGNVLEKLIELKAKDQSLFAKMKQFFDNLLTKIRNAYKGQTPDSAEGKAVMEMTDSIERIQQLFAEALVEASENLQSAMESVVEENAKPISENEIITDGAVVTDGNGNKYSIKSMKHDIAEGQMFEDLKKYCNWTQKQVTKLKKDLEDLVAYMAPYRDILDMNETYDREGRRFSPYKPNSDPLYKISMDFSTLCSKRLLTQYVIENLQLRENRPMSAEEQLAIRDMLNEYRKVEKGLQVACAMCYVEAARLKSPNQINKWLADPATQMKNYFADKDPEFAAFIKEKQADFKESRGYARNATKKDMKPKDVTELNKLRPRLRSQYQLSAEELEIIERAKALPNSSYLTAGNLADLSETEPVIYAAYTAFVRTATRSKSLETDEPYYYGDSTRDNGNGIVVTDSFIESVNRENGMRFSSWSDWRIQHLLDYIAAVIDNSVRGAAMHGYTKFGEEVRVLGKTGMMFNMSGVPGSQTGLNEDGSLSFSPTESIDVNEAIQLRDQFPETAGLQCIGVSDDHIIALLRSDFVDYIIPYHVSGLNAALRRMVNIFGWDDYTGTQHAAIDKSIKFEDAVDQEHWHEEPVYSEFFVGYDTGMTGIEAMRKSAARYVQMCKDRGLKPKFEKFVKEENYWKLLIDRKMINQKTGKLIQQKPVTPTFDFDTIKEVVDRHVKNYDSNLEARAFNHIVENWDSIPQRIKDLKKQGGTKAKKTKKAVDTLANQTLAAQPKEAGIHNSDRDYLDAVNRGDMETAQRMVDEAAKKAGYTTKGYHGSPADFTVVDGDLWITRDRLVAQNYYGRNPNPIRRRAKGSTPNDNYGVYSLFFRLGNNLSVYADGSSWGELPVTEDEYPGVYADEETGDITTNAMAEWAKKNGYDSITFVDVYDGGSSPTTVDVVFNPNRDAKSSDPVTYDDYGNVIPLSERFNQANDDIRYSSRDIEAIELSDANTQFSLREEAPPKRTIKAYKVFRVSEDGKLYPPKIANLTDDESLNKPLSKDKRKGKNRVVATGNDTPVGVWINADVGGIATDESGEAILSSFGRIKVYDLNGMKADGSFNENTTLAFRPGWHLGSIPEAIQFLHKDGTMPDDLVYAECEIAADIDYQAAAMSYGVRASGAFVHADAGLPAVPVDGYYKYKTNPKTDTHPWFISGAIKVNRIIGDAERRAICAKEGITIAPRYGGKDIEPTDIWENGQPEVAKDLTPYKKSQKNYDNESLLARTLEKINAMSAKDPTKGYIQRELDFSSQGILDEIEKAKLDVDALRSAYEKHGYNPYYFDTDEEVGSSAGIRYQDRSEDSVSNRSLLANAFEGVAQSDIEKQKIQEYKSQISLIEAEERKLSELNQKIKDLSFAKGPRDTKAIRDLQFKARQTANRINTMDKILLRLEASKPLQDVLTREKEKVRKREQQKGKEALEAYREKATKAQRELLEKWQESRKKGIDSRQRTAMRHKIQNVVKELNDLLLNESKKRHVPDSMKKAVADALSLVNMDTVGAEERAAKYAALIAKETDPDKIAAYTVTMENILRQGDKMGQRLKELRDAYEEIQESDDPDIANAYDPVIAGNLKELYQSIGNTSLGNMTIEQLSDVYDMYKMVLTRVRDANKTLLENIKENISNLASRVIGEVRTTGGEHKQRLAMLDPVRSFLWNNLKPVYAMEHIGSATLTKVFNNVRAGEDTWAKDVTEAREYYLAQSKKYGYDKWDFKKKYRFQSASGLEFELTLEQILSLYAYSKRDQAADHLRLGGFVFDSNIETYKEKGGKLKYRVNTADAHQITPEILADITGKLSKEQMGFVDEMQEYLSTTMGAKGNDVTMKMYGVKLFKEKFYFPLKSAKQFMFEQNEVSGEVKIKNSGFTNKVVAKANNPVILSNFMEVWSGHVNDMSMYHAFVLPLEDFNRVFNYNSPKKENQPSVSVKGTIQSAYSPAAVSYVKNLITDLNGGARTDSRTGIMGKLIGLHKKGAVFASLSVVVQQPSAIARAAALVDTKYFIGPKVDHKRHKALWDEVKQYAPVAIIKEMGYFDTNMGKSTHDYITSKEYSGFKEKMEALVTDSNYRDEILSKAPALADEIAWCSIWEAVKRETQAQHPGLDVRGEPFLMLAGSRFTEVITKTQVYDSVLSRSANMRSKDTGMKMATAFMAEPTTSINMIADALLQGKRGNRKYCRATIGAVIAPQIINSILVSFVYAGRDDDEDETYAEKYIGTLSREVLDSLNPATYIPFIKDIVSIVQGYDVERSDMAIISDLVNAWRKLSSDNLSAYRKVEEFAGSIAQFFGLPVKNIMRDVRGIYQTIMSFVAGPQTTAAGIRYAIQGAVTGKDVSNQKQLYEAYMSGDKAQIARVESRYKDQSSITSAIRKALRENDPRILEAAQAVINGNGTERANIARAIAAEGHFSLQDIQAAINAEIDKLRKDAKDN